ncbi:MAG TPA: hypothetical protein PLF63_13430 [Rubrivivax sp.]|nr:hypothetical protein [Rubrivivax sp.]
MNRIRYAIATLLLIAATSVSAEPEIRAGQVTQQADLQNSPQVALGIGPGSRAINRANTIDGSVNVPGPIRQTLTLRNSPQVALAVGPASRAENRVNQIGGQ